MCPLHSLALKHEQTSTTMSAPPAFASSTPYCGDAPVLVDSCIRCLHAWEQQASNGNQLRLWRKTSWMSVLKPCLLTLFSFRFLCSLLSLQPKCTTETWWGNKNVQAVPLCTPAKCLSPARP